MSSSSLPTQSSPAMPTFASQYHHQGSTHAGGIQPSASFFHPSRPNRHHRRPTEEDGYDLASLKRRTSNGSEEPAETDVGGASEDEHIKQQPKQNRDPLLPLVSPTHKRSGSSSTGPLSPARSAKGHLVRTSLERVLNLRRGMSIESIQHSPGAQGERPPFEGLRDEENGVFEIPASTAPPESPLAAPVTRNPPLQAPVLDAVTHAPMRNYQLHPSRNRFFLSGRLLTGGDSPWAFIGTLVVLFTIAGVWFGTTCVWWWHNESPAVAIVGAYVGLITVSSMFATAMRDPGILPRDLDPDPPYRTTSPSDGGLRVPLPRDLRVRADAVRVKYCPTCKTYRPPRASHCRVCDNCVDRLDHHCQWVNNCIGRRNYTTFITLLVSSTVMLILVICTSALHLSLLSKEGVNFKHALRLGAGSAVGFCLSILAMWPVGALLTYHIRLLLLNITTLEQIRNQAHKLVEPGSVPVNPFSHGGWRKNVLAVLCQPPSPSWLDGPTLAAQDEREVNPGTRA